MIVKWVGARVIHKLNANNRSNVHAPRSGSAVRPLMADGWRTVSCSTDKWGLKFIWSREINQDYSNKQITLWRSTQMQLTQQQDKLRQNTNTMFKETVQPSMVRQRTYCALVHWSNCFKYKTKLLLHYAGTLHYQQTSLRKSVLRRGKP